MSNVETLWLSERVVVAGMSEVLQRLDLAITSAQSVHSRFLTFFAPTIIQPRRLNRRMTSQISNRRQVFLIIEQMGDKGPPQFMWQGRFGSCRLNSALNATRLVMFVGGIDGPRATRQLEALPRQCRCNFLNYASRAQRANSNAWDKPVMLPYFGSITSLSHCTNIIL